MINNAGINPCVVSRQISGLRGIDTRLNVRAARVRYNTLTGIVSLNIFITFGGPHHPVWLPTCLRITWTTATTTQISAPISCTILAMTSVFESFEHRGPGLTKVLGAREDKVTAVIRVATTV